ncbi:MAG: YceI family protein [Thermoanaerobaculales bacterium]
MAPTPVPEGVFYRFEKASVVSFVGSKLTRRHAGGFLSVAGEIVLVDGLPERSRVRAVVDTTSVWSDTETLTSHLKSADFLEVGAYPRASFTSTAIRAEGDGVFAVTGNLDLHGVVREISFPARIEASEQEIGVTAVLEFDRSLWGIAFSGAADDLISDTVQIELELKAFPAVQEN